MAKAAVDTVGVGWNQGSLTKAAISTVGMHPNQESMVVVTHENGQSDFWDGSELSCIAVANIAAGKNKMSPPVSLTQVITSGV